MATSGPASPKVVAAAATMAISTKWPISRWAKSRRTNTKPEAKIAGGMAEPAMNSGSNQSNIMLAKTIVPKYPKVQIGRRLGERMPVEVVMMVI